MQFLFPHFVAYAATSSWTNMACLMQIAKVIALLVVSYKMENLSDAHGKDGCGNYTIFITPPTNQICT